MVLKMKPGRPPKAEGKRAATERITFRVDEETLHALEVLEARHASPGELQGRRSAVLRRIILEAFKK